MEADVCENIGLGLWPNIFRIFKTRRRLRGPFTICQLSAEGGGILPSYCQFRGRMFLGTCPHSKRNIPFSPECTLHQRVMR
ncbi:hypothetical protein TNCV_2150451 [Trichonephila clavipes]|nr:hypothetical protein TNCV_2150451 [Trichonephila clavipes]